MKLCKDCKHNRRDWLFGQMFAKCGAIVNPVNGKPVWYCETERNPVFDRNNECGSTGKLWEKRQSLWQRIKSMVTA